jgi:CHASE3 domain sensor protein/archaellum component FlaC
MMPWNGLKLKGQILTGYSFPIIFLAILSGLVLVNVQQVTQLTDNIKQGNKVINKMAEATLHAIRMERSMRGYLVNQKSRHLEGVNLGRESFDRAIAEVKSSLSFREDRAQWQRFNQVAILSEELKTAEDEILSLVQSGDLAAALELFATDETSDLIRDIQAVYTEFKQVEEQQIATEQSEYQAAIQSLWAIAALGTAIASMVALIFGNLIAANVRHRIDRAVSSLATSAYELLTIVTEYEQIGQNQTSAFNELSLAMTQLSGSSQGTATRSQTMVSGVESILVLVDGKTRRKMQTDRETDNVSVVSAPDISAPDISAPDISAPDISAPDISAPDTSRQGLSDRVTEISQQMQQLNQQVERIDAIANLVHSFTNQTNMLALNAAVEAVHAGQLGRGFAIIADEIRKLALQSRQSVDQINLLVRDIHQATALTMMATENGKQSCADLLLALNQIAETTQEISRNTQEQAQTINQVTQAISTLTTSMEKTSNNFSVVKRTAEQLNTATDDLKMIV